MNVIILAAGFFEELHPMSLTRPGSLLTVGGRPLLEWFLDRALPPSAINRVLIVTNSVYAGHFRAWIAGGGFFSERGLQAEVISNGASSVVESRGAVYDMLVGLNRLPDSEDCLVLGGDNFVFKSLEGFIDWASERKGISIVTCDGMSIDRVRQLSSVETNEEGQITHFEEKPLHPRSTLSAALIYYFPSGSADRVAAFLRQGRNPDRPGRFVEWMVNNYPPVFGWHYDGAWYDISNSHTLEEVDRILTQSGGSSGT